MESTKAKRNGMPGDIRGNGTDRAATPALGPVDRFMALSDDEKETIHRELDRPVPPSGTRPMTAAERRQWEKAKRKVGRPKIGKGTAVVSVTVERDLLAWADAYAKEKGLSRARLVGIALDSFRDGIRRYRLVSKAHDERKPHRERPSLVDGRTHAEA